MMIHTFFDTAQFRLRPVRLWFTASQGPFLHLRRGMLRQPMAPAPKPWSSVLHHCPPRGAGGDAAIFWRAFFGGAMPHLAALIIMLRTDPDFGLAQSAFWLFPGASSTSASSRWPAPARAVGVAGR